MKTIRLRIAAFALAGVAATSVAHDPSPLSKAHDGRWSVSLKCDDTQDRAGLVKGYSYQFDVLIAEGRLEGEFRESKPPAFVRFEGEVLADGALAIRANGLSGSPDSTVGKIPRGTPYRYTMKGRLDRDRGTAQRVELRPCSASFVRQG